MAIIKQAEIWYTKLNPKRPNAKYNKKNPTWELQLRTTSKEVKKNWEAMNLRPKAVLPEDDTPPYWRVNLRKKSINSEGEPSGPVKIVDGQLREIDPDSIGNGSVGNIRIFQYKYTGEDGEGIASVLMAIQLTKHIVYVPKPRDDDFDMTETETYNSEGEEEDGVGGYVPEEEEEDAPANKPSTPALSVPSRAIPEDADY